MNYFLEGILFGLTLTILVGPIFIALTQTAIEKGFKAGAIVGLGVWTSDILIIMGSYLFIKTLNETVENNNFEFWMGIIGGVILFAFGIISFFTKVDLNLPQSKLTTLHYAGFWLKGFLVNTVNPFTFIFWIGVISTYVFGRNITTDQAILFLSSIMMTVVITDLLKVTLAKLIRSKLNNRHITWFGRIAGIGLMCFGIFLIYKVW